MINMIDRVLEHPNRYRLVPVAGQSNVFDLVIEPGRLHRKVRL